MEERLAGLVGKVNGLVKMALLRMGLVTLEPFRRVLAPMGALVTLDLAGNALPLAHLVDMIVADPPELPRSLTRISLADNKVRTSPTLAGCSRGRRRGRSRSCSPATFPRTLRPPPHQASPSTSGATGPT